LSREELIKLKGLVPEAERRRKSRKIFLKKVKKYLLVEKKGVLLQPPNEVKEKKRGKRGNTF
jgi:hypothetical protein